MREKNKITKLSVAKLDNLMVRTAREMCGVPLGVQRRERGTRGDGEERRRNKDIKEVQDACRRRGQGAGRVAQDAWHRMYRK